MNEENNVEETSEVMDTESSVIKELRQQIKDLKSVEFKLHISVSDELKPTFVVLFTMLGSTNSDTLSLNMFLEIFLL